MPLLRWSSKRDRRPPLALGFPAAFAFLFCLQVLDHQRESPKTCWELVDDQFTLPPIRFWIGFEKTSVPSLRSVDDVRARNTHGMYSTPVGRRGVAPKTSPFIRRMPATGRRRLRPKSSRRIGRQETDPDPGSARRGSRTLNIPVLSRTPLPLGYTSKDWILQQRLDFSFHLPIKHGPRSSPYCYTRT
jgi:hypothetical protein